MTAVWDIPLPDSEKIVLLALADCANDEGHCWPSMATLARKCSKSDRTVQAAIKSLVDNGHLTRREVLGKGCNYTVHPRSHCAPEAASPPKPLPVTPEAASDKPSRTINSSSKATPSTRKRASAFILPSDIPADEWRDYEEMRVVTKKPMTDSIRIKAIARLRKLEKAGWPPGDVLSHSTLNNYQGLFPPKDDGNGRTNSMAGLGKPDNRSSGNGLIDAIRESRANREAVPWDTGDTGAVQSFAGMG